MKEIVKFIVNHWELISGAVLAMISLIIQLFKKRPVADSISKMVGSYIAYFMALDMNTAECKFKDGKNKKDYVIQCCIDYVGKYIVLDEHAKELIKRSISLVIEAALSVPQKKD